MRSARLQMCRPERGAPWRLNDEGPRFSSGTRRRPRLRRRTSPASWQMRPATAASADPRLAGAAIPMHRSA
eukprot:10958306-Alexandrium_andersonii.AAC.1